MRHADYKKNLFETLTALDESLYWLKRSYNICSLINERTHYSDEEFDAFETLTSRFARVSDIVIQKVLRSIDHVELAPAGTLLDALNRAHKRGFFETMDVIMEIRELRNEIAHEYIKDTLLALFQDVLRNTPELFTIIDRITAYCEKYRG